LIYTIVVLLMFYISVYPYTFSIKTKKLEGQDENLQINTNFLVVTQLYEQKKIKTKQ